VPTHGHSDVGHFIWRWRDTVVLADAGRARYTKDPTVLAQTDSRGHNVLLVDGLAPLAESFAQGGRWHLRPYSNATVETRVNAASFTMTHDGFARLPHVGTYSRSVHLRDEGVTIEDRIEGTGAAMVDVLWHFGPRLAPSDGGRTAVTGDGLLVSCVSRSPQGDAIAEWQQYTHSSAYGDTTDAPLLRLRWSLSLPCTITTTMSVSPCAA
jgi:hypothetical protein